jgi:hypothetical protein
MSAGLSMKVIFLDIDGVLNCAQPADTEHRLVEPRPDLVSLINGLCQRTGASIVLSSTWRGDPEALKVARQCGLQFADTLHDETARQERGTLIRQWLERHPEVANYAVVDDHATENDGLPLFKCRTDVGLTPEIIADIEWHLNSELSPSPRPNADMGARCRSDSPNHLAGRFNNTRTVHAGVPQPPLIRDDNIPFDLRRTQRGRNGR